MATHSSVLAGDSRDRGPRWARVHRVVKSQITEATERLCTYSLRIPRKKNFSGPAAAVTVATGRLFKVTLGIPRLVPTGVGAQRPAR